MKIKSLFTALLIIVLFNTSYSQTWNVYHNPKFFHEIAIDTANNVWSACEDGLYKYDGTTWSIYNLGNSPLNPLCYSQAYSVFIDNKSNIWTGFVDGYLIKFDGVSTWTNDTDLGSGDIKAINQDKFGNIWVGGPNMFIRKFDGVTWTFPNISFTGIFAIEVDEDNNVWIGTSSGLIRYGNDSTWTTYNTSNSGISNNWVQTIKQGTDDDLWVGTRDGINIFDKNTTWQSYNSSNSGLYDDRVNGIDIDTDSIEWVSNHPASIGKFENGIWTSIFFNTFPPFIVYTPSIAIDLNGNKWVATQDGIAKYDDSGAGPFMHLNIGNNERLCQGDSIRLNVNIPNSTSVWQDGSTNNSFMVTQSGIYWVTVNSNGQVYTDTVSINSYPLYSFTDTFSVCAGDSFVFHDGTVTQNLVSQVSHVNNFQSFDGCDSVVTSFVNVITVNVNVSVSGTLLSANSANSTYQWLDCNDGYTSIPFQTSQYYNANNDGSYAVQIIVNGCTDTSACSSIVIGACAQNYLNETHKIVTSDRATSYGEFGFAIDIDGDYAISSSIEYSSAYILKKDGNNRWSETQILKHLDWLPWDRFGSAVAIEGNYVIVGAEYEDEDILGNNPLTNSGSAYIFKHDTGETWVQTQKLTPLIRQQMARFGTAVSMNGNTIAIGATWESYDAAGGNWLDIAGAVYIFTLDTITGIWSETQKIVASDRAAYSFFGNAVALDGTLLMIGASKEDRDAAGANILKDAGAVYIFEYNGGSFVEIQKVAASDRNIEDLFGQKIAVDKNYMAISAHWDDENDLGLDSLTNAGSAYVFERDTISGVWSEFDKISASDRTKNDNFASSLSIKDDFLLVGALYGGTDNWAPGAIMQSGRAYLFQKSTSDWQERQIITAKDMASDDKFGSAVALETDYALIGAITEDEDKYGSNTQTSAGSVYGFDICPPCLATASFYTYVDTTGQYGVIVMNTSVGNNPSYLWGFGDGTTSTQPYPQHTYSSPGTYNLCLTVTDVNNCSNYFCDTITITSPITINITSPLITNIQQELIQESSNQFIAYPNPTSEILTVDLGISYLSVLAIINNVLGETLTTHRVNNKSVINLNLSSLTPGVYFINIIAGDKNSVFKIVKKK
ncbi:MAG: hypothetical protein COA97_10655 [Flavobacteriales bacterium]|nr:MAG: hypothetical protein COA97_10655 [Flavobacteriales bacterium]